MSWFETWFDSEYYHLLYKDRSFDEASLFIENLISHLNVSRSSKVLDLACGKGRHALQLAQMGFETLGTDLSANSIRFAKQFEAENLKFQVQDMRIPLEWKKFDLVLNLFTSFGYFNSQKENLNVLKSIKAMLAPGGIFVIDFMNATKVINNLVQKEIKKVDSTTFHISRTVENGNILKNIQIPAKKLEFQESVQALGLQDFIDLINSAGMLIENYYGSYNLSPFDESNSDRLIIIGRKND